jgi:hypothetical protein
MAQITIGPTIAVSSFNFYGFQNPSFTAKYIAPQDINGDGIDEVFFYGFETQPNTPQNYSNTSVHVFGWEEGSFKDLTSQWLPYGSNQVEAVGDVSFGDFNGDGLLDVFLSAYADMDYTCNAYQLINKGSYFEKISLGPTSALQHGVASADINRDGFADVYSSGYGSAPQIYLGSANGLQAANFASGTFSGGSGIALGDFLGDGTVSAVFVDHVASQGKDTALYEIVANRDHTFSLDYVSSLPSARLDLPLYGPLPSEWGHSHDIRARGLDFSGDGLLDLLVFSRMNFDSSTGTWPEVSEIQFLENMGEGSFVDVTDQIRIGYNTSTNVTYNPIIRDINGDGLVDIFTDDATFSSTHDSAAILLHQSNGTFVDTAREPLSAILSGNGGMGNVAQGPNQNWYLVSFSRNSQTTLEDVSLTLISTPEHPVGRVNGDCSLPLK